MGWVAGMFPGGGTGGDGAFVREGGEEAGSFCGWGSFGDIW